MPINPFDPPSTSPSQEPIDYVHSSEYTGYRQATRYQYDPGVFVFTLASRRPKTVTARVHAGQGTRTVSINASKRGAPPILPKAEDTDRDTLIAAYVDLPLPAPSGHGPGFDWAVHATYVYMTNGEQEILGEDSQPITVGGPRVPGRDYLNAGAYPTRLGIQEAAGQQIAPGGDIREPGDELPTQIQTGAFLWPFSVMPPAFFNGEILRDDYNGLPLVSQNNGN